MADEHLGVCVVVLNSSGTHFLAGQRINGYAEGFYGLPGGRVDFGELVEVGAMRELLEETKLTATSLEFVGVVRDFRPDAFSFIHFAFVCSQFDGQPQNTEPDKCGGWEWLPLHDHEVRLVPGHAAAIDLYIHKDGGGLRDITSPLI